MSSELSVGHHNVGGGDTLTEPKTVPGGLLGADYEVANGRYRLKKVFGGLNWNPQLRAPLTEPGVNAKAGEYLLAVNGRELRPPTNVYSLFENTAGKIVEITLGPNADGTGSRTVQVVPVANEAALRNRDWVEGNLKKVDKATGGRVAYVYVPNTAAQGHAYFKRYFYPQVHKDAVIVDERFNGGGSVADYYIDILRRPFIANWAMRYGADLEDAVRVDPGAEGDDHRRDRRLRRRPPAVDVPQVQDRPARRPAHVGRPRRHPRLPGADGRRQASPRRTSRSGRRRTAGSSRTKACRRTSRWSRRPPTSSPAAIRSWRRRSKW